MLITPESIGQKFSFYFGRGCQPKDGCIDQLLITMPLYAAIAYSGGALLARMYPRKRPEISRESLAES
jgi:hypothetical protein